MPDYQNGKIYSIRSHLTDDVYIGSTVQSLSNRLAGHKKGYKQWLNKKILYTTSFKIIEKDPENCYVELIENYPCNSKNELERREGEIIRATTCVNKIIVGRTKKEYNEDNKDIIREKSKQYREIHKAELSERSKQYRDSNIQQIVEYQKEYRENNKEQKKEYNKNYGIINKEIILEQKKQYREINKQQISERKKVKYTCECGSTLRKDDKASHERTVKHQTFITSS